MSLQKIGFIGLGLIGGSIAKKLHALHPELTMIATAHHAETVAEAYKEHLIINNTPCELKDFADCDYIFLCTPTKRNIEYLQRFSVFGKINTIYTLGSYHGGITAVADLEEIIISLDLLPAVLLDSLFIKIIFLSADRDKSLYSMSVFIIVINVSAGFVVKFVTFF